MDTGKTNFVEKVNNHDAVVGIVGLGYVGLPLALAFCERNFSVVGLDIDPEKMSALTSGESYIRHIASAEVSNAVSAGRLSASTDFSRIGECDAVIICVPTPLDRHKQPDLSYLRDTAVAVAPFLKRGALISLESTTYPGTTDELLIPLLEAGSGLCVGTDFLVCFSPEREDPNNKEYTTRTIPKVVGGHSPEALAAGCALYGAVVEKVVPVSSTQAAEATKLMENIFRSVNIALVNEMKMIFDAMGIDVWEVIEAAKTKPFGYMAFYPGPGLGGHCIPIDPFYLSWKAKEYDAPARFIELSGEINTSMPYYVVRKTMEALDQQGSTTHGARLLLVGLAYKKDIDDIRESPSLKLWELFQKRGAHVDYHDPFIPSIPATRKHGALAGKQSVELSEVPAYDAVIVSTDHSRIDFEQLPNKARLVIDTRHVCPDAPNVIRA